MEACRQGFGIVGRYLGTGVVVLLCGEGASLTCIEEVDLRSGCV